MRKIYLLCMMVALTVVSFSQNNESNFIVASEFHVTRPLSEIFKENPVDEEEVFMKRKLKRQGREESGDRLHRTPQKFPLTVEENGEKYGNSADIMQRIKGAVPGTQNKASWAGQSATGFRPMDPSGAVGPNHYVQMINSTTFKVYNKTTGAVQLTATLGNLWSPATANAGDPIVMYDKAANRWFLAQFGSGNNNIYIAISTSPDPTGSYYTYTFTSPQFPDYLKFAVWADGYYMTSNQTTQKVFCFERDAMLAGNAAARSVYTNFSPPNGSGFFCPLPGDAADGVLPAVGTPCPIFSYSDNGWGASYTDAINIYNMSVNWAPATPTATITSVGAIPTAAFDASYNASWNDCSQPGTTQKLDGIGGVLMYRAQYKIWGGYNTVVLNWAVKISTTQRSIMWCEMRQNQSTGTWSIYQQGIYNPDAATRWMGAIAMDDNGSIGLSYIKSDATSIYPGIYYTGRRSCDPLGTLPLTEVQVVAGTGFQTGTNRVGDYSHTCLDPDGVTFWSTSEYMGGTSGGSAARTHIFSYQIQSCTTDASVVISLTSGNNPKCPGETSVFTATPVNGGSSPSYQWKVDGVNVGTNSATYSTSTLTAGQVVTCVMTSNLAGVTNNPATSNAITMSVASNVTPAVSIAVTGGSNPTCPNVTVIFTATPTNGGATPSYQWKVDGVNVGTNSPTYSSTALTNGQVVTCVMTSSIACVTSSTATSNAITMSVSSAGTATISIAQTTGTNPMCSGAASTFTATATNAVSPVYQWKLNGTNVGTNSTTYSNNALANNDVVSCQLTSSGSCPSIQKLGSGTTTNATTSAQGAAYPTYYGNGRQQWIVRASELTALGLAAGSITSLGFDVAGTTGDPATLNGYTIKMAHTAATVATTTFQTPTFTTVYGPTNYTPTLNALNTHSFSTPFVWDGTSNICIDICFSNQVVGTAAYQTYRTASSFVACTYYQADGATGAGACTTTTGTTASYRPNITFTIGGGTASITSNTITMTVNSTVTPSVAIALTSGTNPTCAGSSLTFTATPTNGGATPAYQWKVDGVNVGTNSATYTTSSLTNGQVVSCTMTSSSSCASPTTANSNTISVTVNAAVTPAVSIALTSGTNPTCSGSSLTFTATPTNGGASPSYQWKVNGANVGTNSATYTTSSLTNGQVVSCTMTSNAACASPAAANSNSITVTVNTTVTPSVAIALTSGSNPTCSGSSLTFTATPTNGGAAPVYQWKVDGTNVGTNSATYTTSSLTNGQVVSCTMTSNATCASPAAANSNTIAVTVTTNVVPAVSIALTSGSNPTCSGSSLTFTATPTNGGAAPAYQWKVDGTNVGTNSATYTTSSLTNGQVVSCTMTSNASCASPSTANSNSIAVTVNSTVTPSVSIALTSGSNPTCAGSSLTFTATPTNGGATPAYQWKVNGSNVGTNSATYTTSALTNGQIVSCTMTSTASCASPAAANSNSITVTVNANVTPSVLIAAPLGTFPSCAGSSVTFTASPTNGGTTPSYQWKVDGVNVGTNSVFFTTSSLTNGQVVSCTMTSNAVCASPTTANSNAITAEIAASVTPAVSIALTTGSNPTCAGSSLTFTATPTNGGASPSYQWKVDGSNVGTNSATYTTSSLTNGQVVS
ncbi:MAG: hypothetical protein K1X54_13340, partial [Flavobacteriales bacterium]|nr:hypothetical protein [Flavobacteriales bacterium]